MEDKIKIKELEARVQLLTSERELARRILDDAVDSLSLPMTLDQNDDFENMLDQAARRLKPLIRLKRMVFYLLSEDGLDFYCAWSDSPDGSHVLERDKKALIEDGTVAWALNRNRPVMVRSIDGSSYILLHSLMAQDEPMGMLIAQMEDDPGTVMDISLAFLTVILSSTASIIHNSRLYEVIKGLNEELRRKIECLQVSEADLAIANEAKNRFLANIGHEIRTPLNAILGTAVLSQRGASRETSKGLSVIRREGTALLALINDILDLSKIEAGRMEFECVPFDLTEIIEGIFDSYRGNAELKGLDLNFIVPSQLPCCLLGDPMRFRQVLLNLIGNAIKFTDRGEVCLALKVLERRPDEIRLCFSVSDSGIGIAPESMNRLFKSFSQVDNSTSRRCGGTGLGLAISQRIVEGMGGKIEVESIPQAGSRFFFDVLFPIGDRKDFVSEEKNSCELRRSSNTPLSILLVEDNRTNLVVAKEMLKRLGHSVVEVERGREALRYLTENYVDLVLMDIQMPGMDGIEATRIIRDRGSSVSDHDVPVIALTANAMEGDRKRYIEAGMNDYIAKPIMPEKLEEVLVRFTHQIRKKKKPDGLYVMDWSSLYRRMDNDKPLVLSIMDTFLADLDCLHLKIKEAANSRDSEPLRRHSHTLKGASANVGANALRDVGYRLQKAAEGLEWDRLTVLLESLEEEKRIFMSYVKEGGLP